MEYHAKAESDPIIVIGSLNLATSFRDEKESPLYERLPLLARIIGKKPWFDIFLVQELRGSGVLSVKDVLQSIREILGQQWDFYDEIVNKEDPRSAHRTIFWNTMKVVHTYSEVFLFKTSTRKYIPSVSKPVSLRLQQPTQQPLSRIHQNVVPIPFYAPILMRYHPMASLVHNNNTKWIDHPCMIVKSFFYRVGNSSDIPQFNIMNVHAPLRKTERCQYWIDIQRIMTPTSIVIGDLNKFETEREFYDMLFSSYHCADLIPPEQETFVSFDGDRKPSKDPMLKGDLWRSSLDGVILNPTYLQGNVEIISTEAPPRLSDHFFITARIFWAS
jgi:hypothetical protein